MKNIIYNKAREKNIRYTDLGRVLKIIDRWKKKIKTLPKEQRLDAFTILREVRRDIKNNEPK